MANDNRLTITFCNLKSRVHHTKSISASMQCGVTFHRVKYLPGEKSRRGENIPMCRGEARPSMDLYSEMKNPSLSPFDVPLKVYPLKVPYFTNFPTHDFFFGGLLCPPFIFSLKYPFTACNPCSNTSAGGETKGFPSTLSFWSFFMQPMESGKAVILL